MPGLAGWLAGPTIQVARLAELQQCQPASQPTSPLGRSVGSDRIGLFQYVAIFFPQALLAGFSFRTGEHKAFAVRKIAAKPNKVPICNKKTC